MKYEAHLCNINVGICLQADVMRRSSTNFDVIHNILMLTMAKFREIRQISKKNRGKMEHKITQILVSYHMYDGDESIFVLFSIYVLMAAHENIKNAPKYPH